MQIILGHAGNELIDLFRLPIGIEAQVSRMYADKGDLIEMSEISVKRFEQCAIPADRDDDVRLVLTPRKSFLFSLKAKRLCQLFGQIVSAIMYKKIQLFIPPERLLSSS